jgi:hypothetical protein
VGVTVGVGDDAAGLVVEEDADWVTGREEEEDGRSSWARTLEGTIEARSKANGSRRMAFGG